MTSFVSSNVAGNSGLLAPVRHDEDVRSRVAMAARGPNLAADAHRPTPIGWKRRLMRRMPSTHFDTETLMKRIVTVLVKNIDEKWRDAPMRTRDIMKEVGLRGRQIKTKKEINAALYMLLQQKVVHKYKQNPIRWEIHEEYRANGVPRVCWNENDPWRYCNELEFERVKVPKYGPIHGQYRPNKVLTTKANAIDIDKDFKYLPDTMPEYLPLWTPPEPVAEEQAAEQAAE